MSRHACEGHWLANENATRPISDEATDPLLPPVLVAHQQEEASEEDAEAQHDQYSFASIALAQALLNKPSVVVFRRRSQISKSGHLPIYLPPPPLHASLKGERSYRDCSGIISLPQGSRHGQGSIHMYTQITTQFLKSPFQSSSTPASKANLNEKHTTVTPLWHLIKECPIIFCTLAFTLSRTPQRQED